MIPPITPTSLFYFEVTNLYESTILWAYPLSTLFFVRCCIVFAKKKIVGAVLKKIYRYCVPKGIKSFIKGLCILIASLMLYHILAKICSYISKSIAFIFVSIVIVFLLALAIWQLVKLYQSLSKKEKFVLSNGLSFYFTALMEGANRVIRFLS